uniref:Cation-efflux system membrane protein CzcD n=1 Tax=uncultured bacterium W4-21b TaxID=1130993 RepID=H9BWP1_9BACT|nr:cation-efflux system membrane protein CzcD [uncultured bacterium W4-21b]
MAEQESLREESRKALWIALGLTFLFMIFEIAAGLFSHSLALLADAGHMLTDVLALSLALFAFWIADRPPTRRMSYGFHRAEILAALANGVLLINIVFYIVIEAFRRFRSPEAIAANVMIAFACLGLCINLVCALVIGRTRYKNLNLQGALFHVIADLLGSGAVLVGGVCVLFLGWDFADSLVSLVISFLIIVCAWKLLKDSVTILLEATPAHIDVQSVEEGLLSIEAVKNVHDLHVWTISSGKEALSAHLDVSDDGQPDAVIREVNSVLAEKFGIFHSTLQLESEKHEESGTDF